MSSITQELFTEKFRPKELASLIAPERIKSLLSRGLIQNLLLYGSPGTGKTSALKILSAPYDTLYLNGRESNVETIKSILPKFCATMSLDKGKEKLKCVFIDELDGASQAFFDAIKVPIEKYSNITRFIASTNFLPKIPEGVQDRFDLISFDAANIEEENYLISEYKKRLSLIFAALKITYTEQILDKFVRNDFPSLRSLLVKSQSFYLRGIKELNEKNFNINFDFEDLYKMCLEKPKNPAENYKFIVSEYASRIDDTLAALGADFIEYLKVNASHKIDKIPMIIIAVAEHQAQRNFVIDPLITLLSAVYKLQIIINT